VDTEQRYEIIEESHAEGGFGRIAKRRDKLLDRLVAVKQLRCLTRNPWRDFGEKQRLSPK
jgi:hypothetical protein